MTDGQVSFDEHERLALAMLAVDCGEVADVRDAMRTIITSAPDATDVALVLLLAISHAEDRALMRLERRGSVGDLTSDRRQADDRAIGTSDR